MSISTQTPETFERSAIREVISDHGWTILCLGATAIIAHTAQRQGVMLDWPDKLREVGESMAHPVLGYVGAVIGDYLSRYKSKISRSLHVSGWGSCINFSTEFAQSFLSPNTPDTNFLAMRNIPETSKDYAFAFFGIGLFALRKRHKRIKSQKTLN